MISDYTSSPITHYPDGTWVMEVTVPRDAWDTTAAAARDDLRAELAAEAAEYQWMEGRQR